MALLNFRKRVALVTGASNGIGAAAAIKLAECGVKVTVNYRRSEQEARKVMKAVTHPPRK